MADSALDFLVCASVWGFDFWALADTRRGDGGIATWLAFVATLPLFSELGEDASPAESDRTGVQDSWGCVPTTFFKPEGPRVGVAWAVVGLRL